MPRADSDKPVQIDLRRAINAVSDVVQNRPRPLREFDQIYMKTGDMVLQSEFVANWADGKRLAFIGDGDAISVCVSYLHHRKILPYGPTRIMVYDFDERVCQAVKRFADKERLETLDATHYNCLDPFPGPTDFDCFYTNPPWGASNEGRSVVVFAERGMEAVDFDGEGMVVIADDPELPWPDVVKGTLQRAALDSGFVTSDIMPRAHSYHLDDAPELRSCNVILRSSGLPPDCGPSQPITDADRVADFYGRGLKPQVRYVHERRRLEYGKASEDEYRLEYFKGRDSDD